ncbi:MAG: hypothetical protein HKN23_05845 [Verrucomicrobiales bacterium]|nr:hypothetical protein [Verrucomicrobiales bacterium]
MKDPLESAENAPRKRSHLQTAGIGCGLTAALVVVLAVVTVIIENRSGAREWKRVHEKLVAENVELDPKKILPPLPAPEENFGAEPMIASLGNYRQDESGNVIYGDPELAERFSAMSLRDILDAEKPNPNRATGKPADFAAVAEAMRKSADFNIPEDINGDAAAVLAGLERFSEDFARVDNAALRPRAVLELEFADTFLDQISMQMPYIRPILGFQSLQSIRVCAALETGDTEQARSGIRTMLQTSKVSSSQPLLVGHLVRVAGHDLVLSTIWQGLNHHQFTEEDLAWLEGQLAGESDDILENLELALNLEMIVMTIGACDFMKSPESRKVDLLGMAEVGDTGEKNNLAMRLVPDGIWDHNKAFGAELLFDTAIKPIRERNLQASEVDVQAVIVERKRSPRSFMAAILFPATSRLAGRSFEIAATTDMARVAIAMERFKLANGKYPASLDALVPKFLPAVPKDIASPDGSPLKLTPEGDRYRIYSVGKNGTDEGGKVAFREADRRDVQKGDWAWGYNFEKEQDE